jgi:hypothetical protein
MLTAQSSNMFIQLRKAIMEPKITSTSAKAPMKDTSLFFLGTVIVLISFALSVWILVDVSTDLFANPIFHSSFQ